MSVENTTTEETPADTPQVEQQDAVQIDDENINSSYANFCRVSGTPEELILDFGLNPQPIGVPTQPIKLSQRVILNHYTAKRLLGALSASIQRHEQVFGSLETDIGRRVQSPNPS